MYYLLFYFLGLITLPFIFFIITLPSIILDWKDKRNYDKNYYKLTAEWDSLPEEIKNQYRKEFESRDEILARGFDKYTSEKDKYFRLIYICGFKKIQ